MTVRDPGEDRGGLLPRGGSGSCTGVRVIWLGCTFWKVEACTTWLVGGAVGLDGPQGSEEAWRERSRGARAWGGRKEGRKEGDSADEWGLAVCQRGGNGRAASAGLDVSH